jgi:hypothetical protein
VSRGYTEFNQETLTSIRAQLDEAGVAEAWEQGRMLTIDDSVALALHALGEHAADSGHGQ